MKIWHRLAIVVGALAWIVFTMVFMNPRQDIRVIAIGFWISGVSFSALVFSLFSTPTEEAA